MLGTSASWSCGQPGGGDKGHRKQEGVEEKPDARQIDQRVGPDTLANIKEEMIGPAMIAIELRLVNTPCSNPRWSSSTGVDHGNRFCLTADKNELPGVSATEKISLRDLW